jgi:GntR family transcriptional regulator of arabinose operon
MKYKYQQVYENLKNKIDEKEYKFGDKLPSENTLCIKYNISRESIRKAYTMLIKDGYAYSIHGSGYFVKKSADSSSKKIIGIIISYMADHMYPSILMGIQDACMDQGYAITLGITQNQFSLERKCLEIMSETEQLSGLIVEGTKSGLPNPNINLLTRIREKGIPIVFIHNYYRNFDVPSIMMDDLKTSNELTKMMIDAGHRHIGGIFKHDDLQGQRRFQGYIDALNEAGIPINDEEVDWFQSKPERWSEGMYDINIKWNMFQTITALLPYNDLLTEELYNRLKKRGIYLPEDISVASFDDQDTMLNDGHYLTSAHHPRKKIGEEAAKLIINLINGNESFDYNEKIVIPTKIIVRDSILPCEQQEVHRAIES